jgi:spore maturation protein CgeB
VSYIGSPYEDRPQFLLDLAKKYNLPITISGPGWEKVLNKDLRRRYTLGGMLKDAEYRENIWKSKINLSFITRENEEDVAHKAFEIAACGGFLLALRSPGHEACFQEGKEAEYFSSLEECAAKIRYYLDHPVEREKIAGRGYERAISSGYDNDTQLQRVLDRLEEFRTTRGKATGT